MSEAIELPQLNCQLASASGGVELSELTVGSDFLLKCDGLLAPDLKDQVWFEYADPSANYNLKVLKLSQKDAGHIELIVTSYRASEYTNQNLVLTDGNRKYAISNLNWKVNSVLKPGEKPEILPPMGPFSANYPYWIWIALALITIVILAPVIRVWRRHIQKRRLIFRSTKGDLSEKSASPMQEFNKTYRQLLRSLSSRPAGESMSALDTAVRAFILRKLLVPTFDWSTKEIIKDIKRNHKKVYLESSAHLNRLFNELDRLRGSGVNERDVEQMMNVALELIERIDRIRPGVDNELR